ncbi:DDE-type integrase/transposase/recombinase, partial [Sulfitobacter sp. 1A13353]|uniref:DDE-type integrase/transposase/recombinase n=1 Tax=Sulfitobacter sp. 1A13353 TaxID=3368568 RepID=UPI00374611DD
LRRTDQLGRRKRPASRELHHAMGHDPHKGLNNRAENSHLPFRKRERCMQGFRSPGGLQRFVACHSATRNRFSIPARRRSAIETRYHRIEAFDAWKEAASI